MSIANYNGRQPNNTSYIKNFVEAPTPQLWMINEYNALPNVEVLTPEPTINDVYIPGNLYIGGKIINVNFSNNSSVDLLSIITNLQKQIDVLTEKLNSK